MNELRHAAEHVCARLATRGHRALFAGGCVRDMLLGIQPKDYDIATSATPEQVAAIFDRVIEVGVRYGVQLVREPAGEFEVTTFRTDGPYLDGRHPAHVEFHGEKEDALRRDFTINAMFFDPATSEVIDYTGGRDDLRRGIIRTVGDPTRRFQEDHLRLLRAVRFAARLDFDIAPETFEAIRRMAHFATKTSAERIRDELLKTLTEGGARRAFELMGSTGLLDEVLPEVARMKGVPQPEQFHPEGDVFEHTLLMLGLLDRPSPSLALGALLHDVGKPPTMSVSDRIRFNSHDKVGAEIAKDVCRRLRMPNALTERVGWLVQQHMRVTMAPRMRESKLIRFIRSEGFDELMELCRLDCLASHRALDTLDWVADYIREMPPERIHPRPLISGDDLINMGYRPGPVFAEIIDTIEDMQLEAKVGNSDEAREFVRTNWPL